MGFGGISIWQLVIILIIVILLFGTKRLKGLGADLGTAIKGFKKSVSDDDQADKPVITEKSASNSQDADFSASEKSEQKKD